MHSESFPIKYLQQISPGAALKSYRHFRVLKYTFSSFLCGLILVANGLLLNYRNGFNGPWFHIFDYSPDFAVIILSPFILGLLFCFIGICREQLVLFNRQIKYNLSQEQMFSSAADQQISLLAKVVEQINEAVIIADRNGLALWVNDGFTAISGYQLKDILNKKPGTILQGGLTDKKAVKKIRENLSKGEAVVEELVNYRKDGTAYWVRISIKPIFDEAGNITHFIAIQNDITSRKEREIAFEALYKEVADYKFALDQSAIVSTFNDAGKIVYVNKKFCDINGVAEADIIGKDYRTVSLSMRNKTVMGPVWASLAAGYIWKGELVNRNCNGKSYWAETTIVPLLDKSGKPTQFLAIQNDITERKELENELLTNKNKLELAMQIAQLGTWEIDTINRTLHLSKELRVIYQFPLNDDISLDEFCSRIHKDDIDDTLAAIGLNGDSTATEEIEYRFVINGETRYMVSNISIKKNEEGIMTGTFGTAKDITQKKLTDLALKKSEEEKAVVLNNAQTMICIHDMDGVIIDVNAAGEKMSGFTKKEVVGLNLKYIVSPEYQEYFQQYLADIKQNKTASGSLQIINKAGQRRAWLYQNTVYDNNGNAPYVIASSIDITESVIAQNEIEQQRQFIRQIIDNSPNVIYVMNEDRQIILSNKTFANYYQFDDRVVLLAEDVSKGPGDIFLGDIETMRCLKEGEILRQEGSIENQADNNNLNWFSIIKKCFKEKSGKKYILCFGMDITQRHQVQSDLIVANEMVERSLKVKDQFISNMSHEIRTPLNAVIGFTDLLAETPLNHEQGQYIDIVKTASQNLLALINNILDLSKIESGNLALESLPIDIKKTVIDVTKILEPKAKNKSIQILYNVDSNVPDKMMGDQLRLSQILFNLLGNAVKFTDEGHVEVGCKMVNGSDNQKFYIAFYVKDTGIGVPQEKQDDIFERFTQANTDTQRLYGGTGLGLNIAKSIVDMYGGTLRMESVPGQGTTFHFILPFKKHEESENLTEVKAIDGETILSINAARPIHILLAEDNVVNAMLARQVLEKGGFVVDHVVNGLLAVEKVQKKKYDVVLMDIQMPVMNGILATKNIRQLTGALAEIPIVAMTAHSLYGEMQNCYNAGMSGYVSKPFKPANLYTAIIDAMNGITGNKSNLNPLTIVKETI